MQVILLEKVVNLGGLGDVVKVKDGYARNYLLPQGKAKRATPESLAEFEKKRAELEQAQSQTLATAQEKAQSSKASWSRSPRRQASTDTCSVRSRISTSSKR